MKEYIVRFPEKAYSVVNFNHQELPGVAFFTSSLKQFKFREVFRWHLSIYLPYEDCIDNKMPSQAERDLIYKLGDRLEIELCVPLEKTNALFFGRVTWGGEVEYIFRVHDPGAVNLHLQDLLRDKSYAKSFDNRMEEDENWKKCEWLLKVV